MTEKEIGNVLKCILTEVGIFDHIIKYRPIIAGGCIGDLLRVSNKEVINDLDWNKLIKGDIDIFLPESEKLEDNVFAEVIKNISVSFKTIRYNNFQAKISLGNKYPEINLVHTRSTDKSTKIIGKNDYNDLYQLLLRFDQKQCKCGIIFSDKDSWHLFIDPNSSHNIYNKIAELSDNVFEFNTITGALARLFKYKCKGFKISELSISKLLAHASVNNFDLTNLVQLSSNERSDAYMYESNTYSDFLYNFDSSTYLEVINYLTKD